MRSTVENLSILIRTLATETNRAPSTVSRLVTGSGDTLRRIEERSERGLPVHRISTERVERSLDVLSQIWPADLASPADVPRPPKSKDAA
jgi:hypothetical protein